MEQSKQSEIIKTALENVKTMVDSNTVTGTPINLDNGTIIIPISKVFVGLATGGVDYFGKKATADKNFGGGGGTGVTVSPVGFLVIDKLGKVELMNLNQKDQPKDTVSYILDFIENSPELIERFKQLFSKNDKKKEADGE
ncbi:MAG: sporulation protein YtfJ [Clostridia bacterium]|nr:sporulation protein YtfJ [Clostridia bacterium]